VTGIPRAPIQIAPSLQSWLAQTEFRLYPSTNSDPSKLAIKSTEYFSPSLTVMNVAAHGLERILFRNHIDKFLIVITENGVCTGTAGYREFRSMPGRFAFTLFSQEVLQLRIRSPQVSACIIQLSTQLLLQECKLHEIDDPDLYSLFDSIPGHEPLLMACSRQLLDVIRQPDTVARKRLVQPLEASILSLLASLVGTKLSRQGDANADLQPQSQHVRNALEYFEGNIKDPITLTELCNHCNISARTLQTAFQVVMNVSPLQALQEMRLTKLRQLLLNRIPVSAACEMVGLQPSGRVAGYYKKMFGELPSQTRQKLSEA